ncbi:polyprenyl synthetase [Streptomyces marincola]|uniref:Polyprenyl synthetase n=1 Tax=Streptomyces marincola TaxID=2878388 RepID=A0A1W7CV38_9ACTN|nr:polyprenyl synthetase [Streptomyces marincola]ARQ68539.1 polyprenyl synthetase [Streptomyces marincola]
MAAPTGEQQGPEQDVVLLAAGLADLAVGVLGSAVGTARRFLRRSDAQDLIADAVRDLRARGRLALDRQGGAEPAYLDVLARQVLARRDARQARTADTGTDD